MTYLHTLIRLLHGSTFSLYTCRHHPLNYGEERMLPWFYPCKHSNNVMHHAAAAVSLLVPLQFVFSCANTMTMILILSLYTAE